VITAGATAGSATLTATISKGTVTDTKTFAVTVKPVNVAPTIATIVNANVAYDTLMTAVTASGSDANSGDTLRYVAMHLPTGITIDSSTGIISGKSTLTGDHNATIAVFDDANLSASTPFNITIGANPNNPSLVYTNYVWGVGGADNNQTISIAGTSYTVAPYSSTINKTSAEASTSGFVSVFNGVVNGTAFANIKPAADYANTNIMIKVFDATGNVVGYSTEMDVGGTGSTKLDVNITF